MEVKKLPPDEVLEVIKTLQLDDYIKVQWFDANGFRNYPLQGIHKIAFYTVETVGRFGGIFADGRILTVITEKAGDRADGTNIPVGCILAVKPISPSPKRYRRKVMVGEAEIVRERVIYVGA